MLLALQPALADTFTLCRAEAPHSTRNLLVPLSLDGEDSDRNLAPDPPTQARHTLEIWVLGLVCSGSMRLDEAQAIFRNDWTKSYRLYFGADP